MTGGLVLQFRKEVRALLPWWAGVVAVLVICRLLEPTFAEHFPFQNRLLVVSLFTYALGAICLGALSMGHEFGSHTLPGLLTQPVARHHVLTVKAGALMLLLGLLAIVGLATFDISPFSPAARRTSVIFWFPLLSALCLAPWLTMLSRATLPGVVFTVAVPVALFITGGALGVPYPATWPIAGVFAVVGALLTWRTFVRLEVAGDRAAELDLVPWHRTTSESARTTAVRRPYRMLFRKELRLQQITFVLGGFLTALWVAVALSERLAPDLLADSIRYAAVMIHGGLVSILCGALASAEERRLGTAEWHRLLPVSHRSQWLVKIGTALGAALLLASALPATLHVLAPEPLMNEGFHPVAVIVLCASALYVSSLSNSGIHATLATLPVMAIAAGSVVLVISPLIGLTAPLVRSLAAWVYPLLDVTQPDWRWHRYAVVAGWTTCLVLVLAFAGANHRTGDRSRTRILRQFGWLTALALTTLLMSAFIQAVMLEWRRLELLNR